ncbi:hypothetical protein C8R47DRAFT_1074614 [Mycena vitilis]|nr:hypothetical protein C8R47DRAFT_1074614 [Mycena vitilis]
MEPTFSTELEREIFETAALVYPETIPLLLRVARRVLTWIEPLLYRVVILSSWMGTVRSQRLLDMVNSRPPKLFHAVRHLALWRFRVDGVWTDDAAKQLLALCTRRLSLELIQLTGGLRDGALDLAHDLFRNLTHLHVWDADHISQFANSPTQTWARIFALPALTHLRLDHDAPWDMVLTALVDCPQLELLMCLCESRPVELASNLPVYDVRFVIALDRNYHCFQDWEEGAKGRPDLWSQADRFVARKRKGEVKGNVFHPSFTLDLPHSWCFLL